jgi:predicted enzyme related to lactoylglutathione lyase
MADTATTTGVPNWIDLGSPDVEGSRAFYTALFGWTADTMPQPEAGGYTMFRLDGKDVAGVGPLQSPEQPPVWTTYVSVEDAAATAGKARDAGGTVLMEPFDVMSAGRMAILQDPTGAVIALWQPGNHKGAGVFNVPGAMTWNELATRDVDAAKRFYNAVFGWDPHTHGEGSSAYTEWHLDGRTIGGMMGMGDMFPPQVPPHWLPYFAVADCAATAARAQELGAQLRVPPTEIEPGTFAVIADPQGAVFAVIQPKS